ncbi:hypothetical protein JRO89_XS03G0232900 [Xanthoceras sorbifolium]|uniref:SCP domain-containing protein n=1 Tax=Xanthoceras sorbifolium TaxID=99658 RepID=A0ABQ8IBD6_9ROSI|nr:hypothetical protein JRO89_XS03G0232900 [Xanthoceras sorbifolium]
MEIKPLFSYTLLATLLLFSSLHSLTFSHFTFHRRLLYNNKKPAHTHINAIQQFLGPHNVARSKLGLPQLKWSKKLARFASWWANQRRREPVLGQREGLEAERCGGGVGRGEKLLRLQEQPLCEQQGLLALHANGLEAELEGGLRTSCL